MRVVKVESKNVVVKNKDADDDHMIAVIGLSDVIVIRSNNATIIAKKNENLEENLIDLILSLESKKQDEVS